MNEKLMNLLNNSYSPYSKFRVAAIVVMKNGQEFSGVNVENASYGMSICAERNAIFNAVANGYRKGDFEDIYVLCGDSKTISFPCFACRQVIQEFFELDSKVICMDTDGNKRIMTVAELCPYPFDSEDLK